MEAAVAGELAGKRIAFVTANEGVEQIELTTPWQAVRDAGGIPRLLAPKSDPVQAMNHLDQGDTFTVDDAIADVDPGDFDGLVLPGGVANPDQLRTDATALEFVREMFALGKPAAVICHGPWTLVEAGVVSGRTLTSWPSVKTDIRNAGGSWVDKEVQVCEAGPNVLVTSRKPDDLPAFCRSFIDVFQKASVAESSARGN
jgi:protease I